MATLEAKGETSVEDAVLYLLVVGFHHQKGSTVEFCYPSLALVAPSDGSVDSITARLPVEWRHLPHLALPDGCHNYEEDAVFFALPGLQSTPDVPCVYGVACCKQMEARKLLFSTVPDSVTRFTIQKSVCVLSRYPTFGFFKSKLKPVVEAYFSSGDLSNFAMLQQAYTDLNSALSDRHSALEVYHLGLSPSDQVMLYRHRLLQVFKALLLQKRVMIFGSPASKLCSSVVSIATLFPGYLESLVENSISSDSDYQFPLSNFTSSSLQPYLALQQMTQLEENRECMLAGVVNPLYEKQHLDVCSVFVNMETGLMEVCDKELGSALSLTAADLRFCSVIEEAVVLRTSDSLPHRTSNASLSMDSSHAFQEGSNSTGIVNPSGTDKWMQAQFKLYLVTLLATCMRGDSLAREDFNDEFVSAWMSGETYQRWLAAIATGDSGTAISIVKPVHICDGELSVGDLKRKVLAQLDDYGYTVQLSSEQVLQETQRVVSKATDKVTSAVSSLWNTAATAMNTWWWTTGDLEPGKDKTQT